VQLKKTRVICSASVALVLQCGCDFRSARDTELSPISWQVRHVAHSRWRPPQWRPQRYELWREGRFFRLAPRSPWL